MRLSERTASAKKGAIVAAVAVVLMAFMAFAQQSSPAGEAQHLKVGSKAPEFTLLDTSGQRRSLGELHGRKLVALIFYPRLGKDVWLPSLRSLQKAQGVLEKAGTTVVVISPEAVSFNSEIVERVRLEVVVLSDGDRAVAKAYGSFRPTDAALQPIVFLIDRQGSVRHIERSLGLSTAGSELANKINVWRSGMSLYEGLCARCHGSDGKDDSYPFIKTLAGIGNRMTENQILQATENTGVVDLTRLTEEQRRALAVYVSGL